MSNTKNSNPILDHCIGFLKSQEFKKELKEILKPIFDYFFKEISVYLFFFSFFVLSSFLLHLGVLILLIRYNKKLHSE